MHANSRALNQARATLEALRTLSGPGSALSRADQLERALNYDVTLKNLGLANWEEFGELKKRAALADASKLVAKLRSLAPGSASTYVADLYNIIVHHEIPVTALGITQEDLQRWVGNDLQARVASQKD